MEFPLPPSCLYFILYKSQSGELELELELGTKSSFLQRINYLESTGNTVLEKECVEEEFDTFSTGMSSIASAEKRAVKVVSARPGKRKRNLSLVASK